MERGDGVLLNHGAGFGVVILVEDGTCLVQMQNVAAPQSVLRVASKVVAAGVAAAEPSCVYTAEGMLQ